MRDTMAWRPMRKRMSLSYLISYYTTQTITFRSSNCSKLWPIPNPMSQSPKTSLFKPIHQYTLYSRLPTNPSSPRLHSPNRLFFILLQHPMTFNSTTPPLEFNTQESVDPNDAPRPRAPSPSRPTALIVKVHDPTRSPLHWRTLPSLPGSPSSPNSRGGVLYDCQHRLQ